jgi:hypothetical protein
VVIAQRSERLDVPRRHMSLDIVMRKCDTILAPL